MDTKIRPAPRYLVSVLVGLLLVVLLFPFAAGAQDYSGTLNISGKFENRQFSLTPRNSELLDIKAMVPGDKWTGKITVHNDCDNLLEVSLHSIRNELQDTTLFDVLTLRIRAGDTELYSGRYNTGKTEPYTDYFRIEPGKDLVLDVEITLPKEAGNEVMGKEMKSSWIFDARYNPKDPGGEEPSTQPTPTKAPTPAQAIQTGFNLNGSTTGTIAWVAVAVLAGIAILAAVLKLRKKDDE